MILLSREIIERNFSMRECMNAVKEAFRLFSENKVKVPLCTQIATEDEKGNFLCMPAYCEEYEASCVKVLNMFPENIKNGIPTINAQVLIMNTKTGVIDGIIDGNYLTQLRTGAASGVALELLAKKECKKGALIGTGGQAPAQLEAMIAAKQLKEVQVFDLDFDRCRKFTEQMSKKLEHYGAGITAVTSSDIAVEDADVIITVTPSFKPVFDGNKVKSGATICGVGSYQPKMQEIPPSLLTKASKIYFDSEEAVLSEAGDILIPLEDGTITRGKFTGDIGQVILGNLVGRENENEIIFFKTVGIAAQDLITAKFIFDKFKVF